MKLVVGNKCYSSWSLRPWLLMRALNLPFEEVLLPFGPTMDDPTWKAKLAAYTPGGKVPALVDGTTQVWESLAIVEYLAEAFPQAGVWPKDKAARAFARCIASEMHAGFNGIRGACPMNLGKRYASRDRGSRVAADVARLSSIWNEARANYGKGGPFLFGAFSAADAMFAPVATRIRTYGITVDAVSEAWIEAIHSHPAFVEWRDAALNEPWIVAVDETDEPAAENFRPHLPW
ncbi:MAG: glutathione S-transferase family protein [Bosea sp. (in: a-proteobacteria)]